MGKKISATEASKRVGKSVPTITRAINKGKLSAEPNPKGGWLIDPSELKRVYGDTNVKGDVKANTLQTETPNETRVLEVELKAERDMRARLEAEIEDLKAQRDKWQTQAERLLLEKPVTVAPAPVNENPEPVGQGEWKDTRGWWDRLRNKQPA